MFSIVALTGLFAALFLQAQASDDNGFDDLGPLMLGGVIAAIALALVVAFVRIKVQNRKDASSDFSSISPSRYDDRN